jgi:hypothetical protein
MSAAIQVMPRTGVVAILTALGVSVATFYRGRKPKAFRNTEHHHSGIGLMTPHDVHSGLAVARREDRATVLAAAHQAHPERFMRGLPTPAPLPTAVWINKPSTEETTQ